MELLKTCFIEIFNLTNFTRTNWDICFEILLHSMAYLTEAAKKVIKIWINLISNSEKDKEVMKKWILTIVLYVWIKIEQNRKQYFEALTKNHMIVSIPNSYCYKPQPWIKLISYIKYQVKKTMSQFCFSSRKSVKGVEFLACIRVI